MKVVDECKFDGAYTFIFSPRPHTPAYSMEDKISMDVKKKRLDRLIESCKVYAKERNKEFEGRVVKVLVDGESKRNKNILSGYSEENKLVNFVGNKNSIGKIVNVKIEKGKAFTLEGVQVDE